MGGIPDEVEVALGDFDAVIDLAVDSAEAILDEVEALAFETGGTFQAVVDEVDEAGDDREWAIDIVEDAGIDFPLGADDFLLDALVMQFLLDVTEAVQIRFPLIAEGTPVHGIPDG